MYSRDNLLRELRRIGGRVGVNCHWYVLRHTFASQLVMQGVSIFKVSKFLGHAGVTTTERHYAHLTPELLHGDINLLGAPLLPSVTSRTIGLESAGEVGALCG
ncbi:tyrosine-type recombinase/integrase [bacterium AH-315-F18]|nr:tyrosine-type recombinase/integrase [bacterium AH-315-F18]